MVGKMKFQSSGFTKAVAHIMGRAPNYEYMLSNALVKMGKHSEEEDSQLLLIDSEPTKVKQDKGFNSTLAFS